MYSDAQTRRENCVNTRRYRKTVEEVRGTWCTKNDTRAFFAVGARSVKTAVRKTSNFGKVYLFTNTIVCAFSEAATQRTNTEQVPACSQEPVDSTDANIVENSTCLETAQQETTTFTVLLLIESDWSMFSCAPECSKQLPLRKYIANWGVLGHRIDAKISP